jgi:hypothetical protein
MSPAADDQRLLFRNTMRITDGHLVEYCAAIERAVEFARTHAPQLLVDVFIDEDTMRATSFQIYADSAAVERHWQLSDPYIADVMLHCDVERFEVFGTPSPPVLAQLTGGDLPITITPRLVGYLHAGGA